MKTDKLLSVISVIALAIGILASVIFACSFDLSFYEKEYAKGNTAESIGMDEEGLFDATEALLDYLNDKRDDIVVEADFNGDVREVFNERETLHMVDVRDLYRNAKKVTVLLLSIGAVILVYLHMKHRNLSVLRDLYRFGFKYGMTIIACAVLALGAMALYDFNSFWTKFHQIFFDNDLWLLNPNTSVMINMFPSFFFFDLVMKIIVVFLLIIAVISALLFIPIGRRS